MTEKQYVVFNLNNQEFGIDIMNVKEIISYKEPFSIPNAPDFIEGVLNYRGKVIPVVNLKKRFDMGNIEVNEDARIIVITYEEKEIGFIVDNASQTIRLEEEMVDPMPDLINSISRRFITGIGKIDEDRLLVIINLKNVLTDEEKAQIAELEVQDEV
ncbi:MAG: purine-binding chemotaxis protein CheW [Tissierellia bacterium]|nr:purine-binding chemotaxis protein CheW [Tissierellia bacterium]